MSSAADAFVNSFVSEDEISSLGGISDLNRLSSRLAKRLYPQTIRDIFQWAEFTWHHMGLYSETVRQAVRYFLTDVDINGERLDEEDRLTYEKVLTENFKVLGSLGQIGDDLMSCGNSFTSVYVPFMRELVCPKCGMRRPIREVYPGEIKWKEFQFVGPCPSDRCSFNGVFGVESPSVPVEHMKPSIVRWPPQFMEINENPISGREEFRFDPAKWQVLADGIRNGDPLYLEDTPWEFIEALKKQQKLIFKRGTVYHMKFDAPALTLPNSKGWGLPRFLSQFETVVAIALLDKYNEVILSEYLVPFRVLSPPPPSAANASEGGMDILNRMGGADFVSNINSMIKKHARNPADWHVVPTALNYQVLGGEAKNLSPVELLQHYEIRLIRGLGIPPDFYEGINPGSALPVVKHVMFERSWQPVRSEFNGWLSWLTSRYGELTGNTDASAELVPVSDTTDETKTQTLLQLMAAGEVSRTTTFRRLNLDRRRQQRLLKQERQEEQRQLQQEQEEQQDKEITRQAMQTDPPGMNMVLQQMMGAEGAVPGAAPGGGMPAGGAPGAGAPAGGVPLPPLPPNPTVDQLKQHAVQIAQQLYTMHPTMRDSQLTDLSHTHPELHALVKAEMDQMDTAAERQGRMAARSGQM